jgi:hypothetical protein
LKWGRCWLAVAGTRMRVCGLFIGYETRLRKLHPKMRLGLV